MKNNFLVYRLPPVLWMMLIFFLSSIPGDDLPDVDVPFIHLIAHLVEYSVLGILLVRGFTASLGLLRKKAGFLAALTVTVLFALSDEWHQTFVAGRNGDWITVFYDAAFSLLGMTAYSFWSQKFQKAHDERN